MLIPSAIDEEERHIVCRDIVPPLVHLTWDSNLDSHRQDLTELKTFCCLKKSIVLTNVKYS